MSRYAESRLYVVAELLRELDGPTDPVSGHDTKIELVAEFLQQPPVASEWGPVLHRDDVAAGKMEALFSPAEARDFIDVDALLQAG